MLTIIAQTADIAGDKGAYYLRRGKAPDASDRVCKKIDALTAKIESSTASHCVLREKVVRQLDDLHTWHAPDGQGEQTWKNARMAESIAQMSKAVTMMSKTFDRLVPILERLERKM